MTQDEIIEMARQVCDIDTDKRGRNTFLCDEYGLEAFAKLVAEKEREQEPVAVIGSDFQLLYCRNDWSKGLKVGDCLYTTPQQRKPLTDEEIDKAIAENKQTLIDAADNYWKMRRAYARIIEAAHGIKGEV